MMFFDAKAKPKFEDQDKQWFKDEEYDVYIQIMTDSRPTIFKARLIGLGFRDLAADMQEYLLRKYQVSGYSVYADAEELLAAFELDEFGEKRLVESISKMKKIQSLKLSAA